MRLTAMRDSANLERLRSLIRNRIGGTPQPTQPVLGRLDLTPVSKDSRPGQDGLVAEISASVALGNRLYTLSSGGSNLVSLSNWSTPSTPKLVGQIDLTGYYTTSIATTGNLVAIAATPADYDDPSKSATPESRVFFYTVTPTGSLSAAGSVATGFLSDGMRFRSRGSQLYVANEGQPNANFSRDPIGSISIIDIGRRGLRQSFSKQDITFPDLNQTGISLLGSGIRFSGKEGVTTSFGQDAEPEYVSATGNYLFTTLQENNTVARINLTTRRVEAYIGLGWVDYGQVAVDLTDRDQSDVGAQADGFNPRIGQAVAGLRMADGIAAWSQGSAVYFATANEGDARDYDGYLDERRDSSLGYATVPGRLKLIVNNEKLSGLKDQAFVLSSNLTDSDPSNDFRFESGSRTGTPVSFGSRSLSLFDGITGELLWDSWMADNINGTTYNTSLQNIAQFAGIYDDGRSDDKGVEPESVAIIDYNGRNYVVGALERTTAGDKSPSGDPSLVAKGGLLVVYDVTNVNDVDFVTYQQVSRSTEGLEVIGASQSPTGRVLLGVSAEYDSNSVEFLDFGALLTNGNGGRYLASDYANPSLYAPLPVS